MQAAGKIDVDVRALGADSVALSAHKLRAPKGIGALYVRNGLKLQRHLCGGARGRRRRAGTENVPLAAAFGVAAELALANGWRERMGELRDRLESDVASTLGITVNGASVPRVPNTASITFRYA